MAAGNGNVTEKSNGNTTKKSPTDFKFCRLHIDLTSSKVSPETISCEDYEDVFGGIARGFKYLQGKAVDDAYDPSATLIMNLGLCPP